MRSSRVEELITIGALARASGLTASALRFYGDCGLLVPAEVDSVTGYRYYTRSQCERAVLIRRLRGIELSLEAITEVLAGDPSRAERLLDAHVAELARRADAAARVAAQVKRALGAGRGIAVPAADLARAIGQVGTAAAIDDTVPVLTGVLVEADSTALTLTATDRYRLSTRTLAPLRDGGEEWSVVVEAATLAPLRPWLDSIEEVVLAPSDSGIAFVCGEIEHRCNGIEQPFPDYRAVLDGLLPVRTRMLVARAALLELLETADDTVVCTIDPSGLEVSSTATDALSPAVAAGSADATSCAMDGANLAVAAAATETRLPTGVAGSADAIARATDQSGLAAAGAVPVTRLPAVVTGGPMELAFRSEVLRSAVASALGPDLMFDLAAADQPVVVRSANDGDLTTLVMPTFVPSTEDHTR
ncbi:DNA polymerase III subunit beta family protein [Nocardia amikacinitolerans]|uniref:DNA polymerase III subunit beta family protein n=1 Tax=Nocardia amikacinitolerans TaxID=756689 RepID=UPI0020A60240|nr:MerR family transcriptional regulator [Nocardia amikacinitolerans]MCP2292125.1 DNA-binding transcriptional regulator, MerR family [Nocardia amikacinitolerans]